MKEQKCITKQVQLKFSVAKEVQENNQSPRNVLKIEL